MIVQGRHCIIVTAAAVLLAALGCRGSGGLFRQETATASVDGSTATTENKTEVAATSPAEPEVAQAAYLQQPESLELKPPANEPRDQQTGESAPAESLPPPPGELIEGALGAADPVAVDLDRVINSVRNHFPQIREAAAGRVIASGEALAAWGAFDHQVTGFGNAQPLDFYENLWGNWGVQRNTFWGGTIGAGYKLGRGSFEPWYLERETNDGGELSLNLSAPLGQRDREIDANRAQLWRAQLETDRVEPVVRAQVLQAVNGGAKAYWQWVAAGADFRIAEDVLQLGLDRTAYLQRQVDLGEKAQIDLVDNRRIIAYRQAKLADARRKLRQSTVKMGLFLRTDTGAPLILPPDTVVPEFPLVNFTADSLPVNDIDRARDTRPELQELSTIRRQLAIEYKQALNDTRPDIDGGLFFGQDVGNPTSSDDKSEFEIEATFTVSVPLERRKAYGKVRQLRGKFAQIRAKQQFASEKVGGEVLVARAAILAAAERVDRTTEGVDLARQMQTAEGRLYEEGQSTLFNLNLREQQAAEAASERVAAQVDFFQALADYAAAMGLEPGDLDEF